MPPKTGLDRAAVVEAAADLINKEGVASLTLGRLARNLSIRPPSLYNHVEGLAGLRRELALLNARSLGRVFAEAAIGKSGPQAVRAICRSYRNYIKSNPGLYAISLRSSGNLPAPDPELKSAEAVVLQVAQTVLAAFELPGNDSLHAVRGLRSLVHGFATLEVAGGFGLPLDCDNSFDRLVEIFIGSLKPAHDAAAV